MSGNPLAPSQLTRRFQLAAGLLDLAQLCHAAWLFGMFTRDPPPAEREAPIAVWYRLDLGRVAAAAGAVFAAYSAKSTITGRSACLSAQPG